MNQLQAYLPSTCNPSIDNTHCTYVTEMQQYNYSIVVNVSMRLMANVIITLHSTLSFGYMLAAHRCYDAPPPYK